MLEINLHAHSDRFGDFRIGFDGRYSCVWSIYSPDEFQVDDNSRRLTGTDSDALTKTLIDIINCEKPIAFRSQSDQLCITISGTNELDCKDSPVTPDLFKAIARIINSKLREPLTDDLLDFL